MSPLTNRRNLTSSLASLLVAFALAGCGPDSDLSLSDDGVSGEEAHDHDSHGELPALEDGPSNDASGTEALGTSEAGLSAPNFQAPYPCGQTWTYSHHSKEVRRALDFIKVGGGTNGSPVLASAAGTATRHVQSNGAGNYIKIDHGGGWQTYYFHLSSFSVPSGARVEQGQEVGKTGSTGNSSGPHIHYEQLLNGVGQNIVLGGVALSPYPGSYGQKDVKSLNGCTTPAPSPVTPAPAGGELVIDTNNARNDTVKGYIKVSGEWTVASSTAGFYGTGYYWASTGDTADAAEFFFFLETAGTKTVDAWWTSGTNRSTQAPFVAYDATGKEVGRSAQNQTVNAGRWNELGAFDFTAGWNRVVLARTGPAGKVVIADAIRIR